MTANEKEAIKNVRKCIDNNRSAFSEVVNLKECFTPKTYKYLYLTLQSEFEIYRGLEEFILNGKQETNCDNRIQ